MMFYFNFVRGKSKILIGDREKYADFNFISHSLSMAFNLLVSYDDKHERKNGKHEF